MIPIIVGGSQYSKIHYWLRKNYGKATKCENKKCPRQSTKFNWALRKGFDYEFKRENFFQLCRSCHSKHDFTEKTRKKLRKINTGRVPIRKEKKRCHCGKRLKNQHSSRRFCKKCFVESEAKKKKEWREKNKEKTKRQQREWHIKNAKRVKIYWQKYWLRNKEYIQNKRSMRRKLTSGKSPTSSPNFKT